MKQNLDHNHEADTTLPTSKLTLPPEIWSDMSSTEDHITDCSESFHAKFNAEFTDGHPNF